MNKLGQEKTTARGNQSLLQHWSMPGKIWVRGSFICAPDLSVPEFMCSTSQILVFVWCDCWFVIKLVSLISNCQLSKVCGTKSWLCPYDQHRMRFDQTITWTGQTNVSCSTDRYLKTWESEGCCCTLQVYLCRHVLDEPDMYIHRSDCGIAIRLVSSVGKIINCRSHVAVIVTLPRPSTQDETAMTNQSVLMYWSKHGTMWIRGPFLYPPDMSVPPCMCLA